MSLKFQSTRFLCLSPSTELGRGVGCGGWAAAGREVTRVLLVPGAGRKPPLQHIFSVLRAEEMCALLLVGQEKVQLVQQRWWPQQAEHQGAGDCRELHLCRAADGAAKSGSTSPQQTPSYTNGAQAQRSGEIKSTHNFFFF